MKIYSRLSLLLIIFVISCAQPSTSTEKTKLKLLELVGETMGTTFTITYLDSTNAPLDKSVGELLTNINQAVSTYEPTSEISLFNQGDSLLMNKGGHFDRNFQLAKKIYKQSKGWFNPTVMPLVNYWGFGYTKKEFRTDAKQSEIDSLLKLVNFDSLNTIPQGEQLLLVKTIDGLELDFSAIAKGDAVDEVGRLLEANGINNYFVEIGGEIRTRGRTAKGFAWRTGIRKPKENSPVQNLQMIIELEDMALATSGNYENYHKDPETGQKYAHTINPNTGRPEKNSLLSASVFASDCATADAFATAFMAMGLDKAWELAQQLENIHVYFIYADKEGKLQEKISPKVAKMQLK